MRNLLAECGDRLICWKDRSAPRLQPARGDGRHTKPGQPGRGRARHGEFRLLLPAGGQSLRSRLPGSPVGGGSGAAAAAGRRVSQPGRRHCRLPAGGGHDLGRASRAAAFLRRLEYGARLIRKALASGPVALLFGSEKFGLSNVDLSHCHWLMRIPTVSQDLSMNLGQAVSLCLYELARDPKAAQARPEKITAATAAETEQITAQLLEVLQRCGYVNQVTAGSTEEKVRRLVRRLHIAGRDAPVLLGMLRQILWKLR